MAKIESLLGRVADPVLRAELSEAVAEIRSTKDFGLVFESHLPETVRLPHHPVRRGVKVSNRAGEDDLIWEVVRINGEKATLVPIRTEGSQTDSDQPSGIEADVDSLVVIAEFGDTIYPGLEKVGEVKRGGNKPSHIVINAENHHALEALQFTHAGKVDCIYIDPPYNTGAEDWKYNNDYVDDGDYYRHSKWLSFMERRLRLARGLLMRDSVLVVTIDEHEVCRLGSLLSQVFPEADITLVTIVINPKGVTRPGIRRFSRVEEYAFFCFFGEAELSAVGDDFLTLGADDLEREAAEDGQLRRPRWKGLLRSGTNARRADRKNMFYPVLIDEDRRAVVGTGEPLPFDEQPNFDATINGLTPVWPVRKSGDLGRWGVGHRALRSMIDKGYVAVGGHDPARNTWAISYLSKEPQEQIAAGVLRILAHDEVRNVVDVIYADAGDAARRVRTVWHRTRHDAGAGGTDIVSGLVGEGRFTFPKSVFAVRDVMEILTKDKPKAVVLDFFAGSGTTTHATMMLNAEDGGLRQSIVVTNNEVDIEETAVLTAEGYRPGDADWEAKGIFSFVTVPRIEAAVLGVTADSTGLPQSLKNNDGSLASGGFEENVEFFELTYQDPSQIELDRAFNAIAPLLWMRAGGQGDIIEDRVDSAARRKAYAWTDRYGVLFNPDRWQSFASRLPGSVETVFIVTDSPTVFSNVVAELPAHVTESVRLYERYLTTFGINGRPV